MSAATLSIEARVNKGGRSCELLVSGIPMARVRLDCDDPALVPELVAAIVAALNAKVTP